MLRKCSGFTLLETLVSLNIWFILIFSLLPQLFHIGMERHNIVLMSTANEILYEELHHYINYGSLQPINDRKHYSIAKDVMDDNMIKICVSWKDELNRNKMKCGYGKR